MQSSGTLNINASIMLWMLVLLVSSTSVLSQEQQTEEELKLIQQQIQQKKQVIQKQLASAKVLQQQLQQAQTLIANTAKALNSIRQSLDSNKQQQRRLHQQQTLIKKLLDEQKEQLAKLLRGVFMTGNYDYAKMLFNQKDAGRLERTLTYYQYMNSAHKQKIEDFLQLTQEQKEINEQLLSKQQKLQELENDQNQQQLQLAAQKEQRQLTLDKLNKQIDSEAGHIEQLQINEKNLLAALEAALREASSPQELNIELTGLQAFKGKLSKPVQGRLRKLFGLRRQGQVKWKGVLINGSEGSSVQAVHHGKVIYADWLNGFGLVTVLDHGEGYMSLYGYNQALLKQAGDTVTSGEDIALVGQSGGQSSPGLYFEIRYKGQAVNPSRWLKR